MPVDFFEVRFGFGEVEGVDAAVEVGVLFCVLEKYQMGLVGEVRKGKEGRNNGREEERGEAYARGGGVTGDHYDGADGAELGDDAGRGTTIMKARVSI